MDIKKFEEILSRAGESNSDILYVKEDAAGNIIDLKLGRKWFDFEWIRNARGYKRYRDSNKSETLKKVQLVNRLYNFVLRNILNATVSGLEVNKLVKSLEKFTNRVFKHKPFEATDYDFQALRAPVMFKPQEKPILGQSSSQRIEPEQDLFPIPEDHRKLLIKQNSPQVAVLERYFIQTHAANMISKNVPEQVFNEISNAITPKMTHREIDKLVDTVINKHEETLVLREQLAEHRETTGFEPTSRQRPTRPPGLAIDRHPITTRYIQSPTIISESSSPSYSQSSGGSSENSPSFTSSRNRNRRSSRAIDRSPIEGLYGSYFLKLEREGLTEVEIDKIRQQIRETDTVENNRRRIEIAITRAKLDRNNGYFANQIERLIQAQVSPENIGRISEKIHENVSIKQIEEWIHSAISSAQNQQFLEKQTGITPALGFFNYRRNAMEEAGLTEKEIETIRTIASQTDRDTVRSKIDTAIKEALEKHLAQRAVGANLPSDEIRFIRDRIRSSEIVTKEAIDRSIKTQLLLFFSERAKALHGIISPEGLGKIHDLISSAELTSIDAIEGMIDEETYKSLILHLNGRMRAISRQGVSHLVFNTIESQIYKKQILAQEEIDREIDSAIQSSIENYFHKKKTEAGIAGVRLQRISEVEAEMLSTGIETTFGDIDKWFKIALLNSYVDDKIKTMRAESEDSLQDETVINTIRQNIEQSTTKSDIDRWFKEALKSAAEDRANALKTAFRENWHYFPYVSNQRRKITSNKH